MSSLPGESRWHVPVPCRCCPGPLPPGWSPTLSGPQQPGSSFIQGLSKVPGVLGPRTSSRRALQRAWDWLEGHGRDREAGEFGEANFSSNHISFKSHSYPMSQVPLLATPQVKIPRLREVNSPVQGHTVSKEQTEPESKQGLNKL